MEEDGSTGYDDNEEERNEFRIHEGIILAVHLSPTIINNMSSIFSTFLNLLKQLIKTMPNTGLGLYIGNCSKSHDDPNSGIDTPEGIYRVFRLQDINQSMLKTLDRYLKNAVPKENSIDISLSKGENWDKLFPIKDTDVDQSFGHSLYSMLQQSLVDFNNIPIRNEEYTSRKMFFFTDCNKPFNGDEIIKQKIHSKLRDLNSSKITVYPFILNNKHVEGIVKKEDGAEDNLINDGQLDEFKQLFDFPLDIESKKYLPAVNEITLDGLEDKILKHATVKRLVFQCPLIFNNMKIMVKGINPFTTVEWKKIKFYSVNNRLRYAIRKNTHMSNNETIEKDEIVKAYNIADQYLPVDKELQEECLKFGEVEKPILHVIGTRKFKYFSSSYIVGKSFFMIADEDKDEDENEDEDEKAGDNKDKNSSVDKFSAMYKSLVRKEMMILCWGMIRKFSYPRFYYLIPTTLCESYGLELSNYPQSLAVIEIPFGNEVRKAPEYINKLDSLKEIDDAKLLDKLIENSKNETFQTFPNPAVAWKFKIMEDHILQVEIPKDEETDTMNLAEQQLKLDSMFQYMLTLKKNIDNDTNLSLLVNDLRTRYNRITNFNELKRTTEEKSEVNKKVKLAKQSNELLTDSRIAIFYREYQLKNCTNDTLKAYIKSKGGAIKYGKKKDDMISNIVEYLKNNHVL